MTCLSNDTLKVIVKDITVGIGNGIRGEITNLYFEYRGSVVLQLEGTNTLSQNLAEDNGGEKAFYGIYHIPSSPDKSGLRGLRYVVPSLTVINKGTLNITGNVGGVIGNESAGIYATGNLIVDNQGTMTISNPKTLDFSAGLRAYNSLTIKGNGKMTVKGGELTTTTRSSSSGSFGLYSGGKIRILSGKVTAQGGKTVMNPSLGIYAADSLIVAADTLIAQGDSAGMNKKYSRIDLTAYNAKGFPAMMVDTLYDGSTKQSSLYETYFLENDTIKYVEITQGYPIYIGNAHLELPSLGSDTTYYTYSEADHSILKNDGTKDNYQVSVSLTKNGSVDSLLVVTLNGISITKMNPVTYNSNLFIYHADSTALVLNGNNTLTNGVSQNSAMIRGAFIHTSIIENSLEPSSFKPLGIYNKGTFTITGSGSDMYSFGMYLMNPLTYLHNEGTIDVQGLNAGYNSCGLISEGGPVIVDGEGKATIAAGTVSATDGNRMGSIGVATVSLTVKSGTLIAQGHTLAGNLSNLKVDSLYYAKGFPLMFTDTLYNGSTKQSSLFGFGSKKTSLVKAKYLEITQGYPIYIGDAHLELPEVGTTKSYQYEENAASTLTPVTNGGDVTVTLSETDSILTLSLKDLKVTKANPVTLNSNLFIFHADSTKLDLEGTNTFSYKNDEDSYARVGIAYISWIPGLYGTNDEESENATLNTFGIYNKGKLTVEGNTGSGNTGESAGIYSAKMVSFHNEGTIDVTAVKSQMMSVGLLAEYGAVIDSTGSTTFAGGEVNGVDEEEGSFGVVAMGGVTIKSGTVIAQGHTMALEGTPDLNYEKGFPLVLCDTLYDGSTAVFPLIGNFLGYYNEGENLRYYKITPGHPIYVGDQPIDVPETGEGAYYKYSETADTSKLEAGSEADFNVGVQYDNGCLNVALKNLTVTKENPMTMNSNLFIYNRRLTQLNLIGNNKLSHNSADASNFRTGIVYMNELSFVAKSKLRSDEVAFAITNAGNLAIEGNKGAGTTNYGAGAFLMNFGETGLANKGIINIKASDAKTFSTGVLSIGLSIEGDGEMTAAAGTVSEKPTGKSLFAGSYGMMGFGNTSIASGTVTAQGHTLATAGDPEVSNYQNPFIQVDSIYEGTTATLMQMYESKKPVLYYKISPSPIAFIGNAGMQLPAIGTTKYYTYAETSGTGALTPLASSTGANVTASLAADSTLTVTLNDVTITKSSELELRSEIGFNSNLSFLYGHNTHLVFTGTNSLSQNSSTESAPAFGILHMGFLLQTGKMPTLTVTNQGTLNISNNVERDSYVGICAPVLTIDNQKIMNVTASKAANSEAIYAMFVSFSGTGELIAAGNPTVGTGGTSYGIAANEISVKSGIITAQGATSGVSKTPTLQMTDPIVGGGMAYDGSDAVSLTDFTNLNAFRYLVIGKQVSKNLADADVQLNGELILNGNQVRPGVKVTFKGKTLTEGVDYIVTYGPNNEVGNNKGTVTVTGIGDYSGTKTLTFNIYAKPVYVIIEKTDGVSVTPGFGLNLSGIGETFEFTVTPNASLGKEGKDFTIEVRTDRAETLLPIGNKYKIDAVDHETTIYIIVKKLTTGVESIDALNVYGGNGTITIQSPTNSTALVVNMTGQIVKSTKITSGKTVFNGMQKGIYAVKIGSTVMKVVVN